MTAGLFFITFDNLAVIKDDVDDAVDVDGGKNSPVIL